MLVVVPSPLAGEDAHRAGEGLLFIIIFFIQSVCCCTAVIPLKNGIHVSSYSLSLVRERAG